MELRAKSRNGMLVQGKPRVFFCAHERDYACHFDTISDLILKHQNCAVWYWDEPTASVSEEELSSLLSEMQLFVLPVTSAFLHTDNIGRCRDLQFAFDHHIPVLPLAVEAGLAADFNTICGNLQFLDLTAQDVTAISVEEKVATFLQSVLVGDDVAKQVRASFDAYVFLSYRKKDRRHAQELMRKIHENEQCRDVAIWYDEFLVPGEDFNDAISQALDKSDLFALVVTPNLINEPNYVKEHEYPAALESGKPILAAELVKTDRDILEKEFRSIPPCTNVIDRVAFNDDLMRAVSALSLRQNDHDPVHNYYIGLAYMAGIDVEKNAARGVQMIEGAAKAGVAEAMQKLITVYELGDGVPRNWDRSLMWRERLADVYQARYDASKSNEDGTKLQQTLREWSQALARDFDRKKAIEVIRRLVKTAEHIRVATGSHDSDRAVVVSQLELCDLLLREGEVEAAKALIESTGKAAVELVKEENGTVVWWDYVVFAMCHTVRARILEAQGNLKDADFFFGVATELCENAYKESNFPLFLHQLGETSMFYGAMLSGLAQDNIKAIGVLSRATQLLEDAKGDMESPIVKTNLVAAYLMLAQCEMEEQRDTQAVAHIQTAISCLDELMESSPTATVRRFLADAYGLMAQNETVEPREREKYQQAEEVARKQLMSAAPVIDNILPIAQKHFDQGFEALQQEDTKAAKTCFRKAVNLLAGFPIEQAAHCAAGGIITLACAFSAAILLDEERPRDALAMLKEALPVADKMADKEFQMSRSECYSCAMVFLCTGKAYKALGKMKQAKEAAERVDWCYLVCIAAHEKEPYELDVLADTQQLLGELAQESDDLKEAARHFESFLHYAEELEAQSPSLENRVEVGVACAVLADVQCKAACYEVAFSHAERALEIFKQAYKQCRERFLKDNIDLVKEILRTCKRKTGKGFLWF